MNARLPLLRTLGICILAASGCTSPQPKTEPPASSEARSSAPAASAPAPRPSASVAEAPAPTASASAAPSASAAASADPEPVPTNVDVKFYGLHVGGGKNDKAEHAPIIASVNRHLDDFKRCFAKAEDTKKGGTYGIQLLIPADGGKAEVSLPKSGIKGDAFKECMLATYTEMEFDPPKGHIKTNATYSVIFSVKK